ncbi:hypothetical protein CHS0354_000067 [Potamilus streckersoni]|uniref:Chitin-binding type-2 domain-containing protein n=1 Tax=Potamilus streckersoni TaxID=2493646 RepID=A0AAE0SLM6_9BIVA|nr:hypothetical protein CHS0354_000067 [Potamilus streckersoni]
MASNDSPTGTESNLYLKACTMSTGGSYSAEMVSDDTANSATGIESNINDGYTAISDTSRKRNRRLPMPPAFKPHRPKKNITLLCQSCKELCSYCVGSRLILSIPLLLLAMAAFGVVVYFLATSTIGPDPTSFPSRTVEPPQEPGVLEGSKGTLKFVMLPVQSPEVLNLLQESIGQTITILQNVKINFTNGTWSFDGREISVWISVTDKINFHIFLNMDISNSQCRHAGKYFVLISGSHGKAEESLLYNVKAACPCESEYGLNSGRALKCELKVKGETTVRFNKVSGKNSIPILYQTGIRIPDNVPERDRFSAMWNRSGTLTTSINFTPVQCHHEGNYSLTVTSRAGIQLHYTYVRVIDHPNEPIISTPKGLIEGSEENIVQCQATTGCKNASLIVEVTEEKGNEYVVYVPWATTNLTSNYYQEGSIWKANASLKLTETMTNNLKKKCLRCTYSIGDKRYYSKQPICINPIPADFCKKRMPNCRYLHPYDCNKFITCITVPVESTCQAGLHYHSNLDNCTGSCVHPAQANCSIKLWEDCYCGDN